MSKAAAPARAVASRAAVAAPKRGMAGGAAPKYTGWEAKVRKKLPKDEHVVVAISGFYVGLYVVFKGMSAIFSSPKKEEVAAPVAAATSSSSEVPAGYEDDFWQWLEGAGNMEKYLATVDAAE
ncbi:unnamed protein product [Scytosiphon promiscuus]